MDAAEDEVDAKVGDDDTEECESAVDEELPRLTADSQRRMHRESINDECNECPDLFGIPCPVVAPRNVGPQGTDDDAKGEEEVPFWSFAIP